jgi:O-6-methylguanine DNA methyltransferase
MSSGSEILICELRVPTRDGDFVARYSSRGLCRLEFPAHACGLQAKEECFRHKTDSGSAQTIQPDITRRWHKLTFGALASALAGEPVGELPPLDLTSGTGFQQSVWEVMRRIRHGETRSYGEVARAIGRPKALRAVGGACGANPIPVLVPCHRVLAAGARLGGFSGGLDWKRKLLALEGVKFGE